MATRDSRRHNMHLIRPPVVIVGTTLLLAAAASVLLCLWVLLVTVG